MTNSKVSVWFWIIAVLALLWNLMGIGNFLAYVMLSPETLAENYTAEQVELLSTYPSWTTIFFGLATIGGFIACIGLLFRKRWALGMFVLSLLGVVVQQGHTLLTTNAIKVFGDFQGLYLPIAIIVVSIFMIWFTKSSIDKRYVA